MKQLSQNLRTGKLSVNEVPTPTPRPGEVLVQNLYSLISAGTERTKIETGRKSLIGKAMARPDQVRQVIASAKQVGLKATYEKVMTRLDAPSPLGYSASGVVLEAGEGVSGFKAGDLVACGGTSAAHAEVIAVPANLCAKVPEHVLAEHAAFTTVGAIALQGIRVADVRLGEIVVVIGLGLVGQLTVQMLKAAGCLVAGFDLNEERCGLARQSGAGFATSSEKGIRDHLAQITSSHGADAVIVTAGTSSNKPVEMAGELCREQGKVVVVGAVGLTIPREPYYHKELIFRISRSYGPGRYDVEYEDRGRDYPYGYVRWTEKRNMQAFLGLLGDKTIDLAPLITHRFHLEQADQAYSLIGGKTGESFLGVLFEYDQADHQIAARIPVTPERREVAGKLEVGVIGAGNFAQSMLLPHLKNNSAVALSSVTTAEPLQTRDVAERFGFRYAVSDAANVLQDANVKAVIIATRHDSHARLVIDSLTAGKAIHVEKPLALNAIQLEEIQKKYSETPGAFVMVGFNRRFAPFVQDIAQFFQGRREALAMTYRINAGYIPLDHWSQDAQEGGGRIVGEVCHFIDLFQFLAGSLVSTVYARALPNYGKYRDDNVAITLDFSDGSIANILYTSNGDRSLSKEYFEIYGEGKVAVLDDFRILTLAAGGKKKTLRSPRQDKGHKAEMAAWVEAIRAGQSEPVPFEHSVAATKASFAIIKSFQTGAAVSGVNE